MKPTNLLLITADQWRGDCLSSMGHPTVTTPHLDQLAAESTQFRQHYANAVPCGPSRASLHTGMYLHNHRSGTNGTPLDSRFTNWATELRANGYDPVLFGYTHTAMDPRGVLEDHPGLFNDEGVLPGIRPIIDMGTLCPDWRRFLQTKGYQLPDVDGATYSLRADTAPDKFIPEPLIFDKAHTDTYFLTSEVINYIQEFTQNTSPTQQGWCTHLSLRAPHPPWVAAAPYHLRYPVDNLPAPVRQVNVEAERESHPWLAEHLSNQRNRSHVDIDRHRLLQTSYYGLMNEVDDNMGRLINWLKDTGQWDNTLLIFTSDHGEQMGDHWMYGKAGFFDQSYHIPLIIHVPGGEPGSCDDFTEHVDILPTILASLDLTLPRQCDGCSLLPKLQGKTLSDWRTCAHYEYDFRHSQAENALGLNMESACLNVIRDTRYKYVHFADLPCLLFDLQNDPGELTNIAAASPAIVAEYAQKLLSWRLSTTDKTLTHLQISRTEGLKNMTSEG